jgi:hypothetical protein
MLCPYYCLFLLFNKIRDKGRTGSAWKRGGEGRGSGWGYGGEMTQTMCAHRNKEKSKKQYTNI